SFCASHFVPLLLSPLPLLFFQCAPAHRDLHSFPTRRSSDLLLLAVRPHSSPGHARITLPGTPGGYGTAIDGLEGFARTFLLAGFRLAGEQGADRFGYAQWYTRGLVAGTDPTSPERWVRPSEHG